MYNLWNEVEDTKKCTTFFSAFSLSGYFSFVTVAGDSGKVSVAVSTDEITGQDNTDGWDVRPPSCPQKITPLQAPSEEKTKCYIATAVYGSYNCPEVWTLRRFRDNTLAETWYGRLFIRTYYAISPTLVKWFGETTWFQRFWRGKLNKMVAHLQEKGVEDTPYQDKDW